MLRRFWRRREVPASRRAAGVTGDTPAADQAPVAERVKAQFSVALRQFQDKRYEDAAASFAAVEAACPPELTGLFVMAKSRRAGALLARKRWAEALAVFDELAADSGGFGSAALSPDAVPTIHWGRAVCLEQLGRLTEACKAVGPLIDEVGSGTTPAQREYVAGAYLLQARIAEARGRFDDAFKAVDAAITQCSNANDPRLKTVLREAEQMQQALRARVRALGAPG